MDTKSIQRIIIAQPGFQFSAGEKRDDSRSNSDNHSATRRHISASRRDDHEPTYRTRTKTEDARFPPQCVFKHCPCKRSYSRGQRRAHKRVRRYTIRRKSTSRVETVPAHPKQTGSYHAEHHAVRRHDFFFESEPVPEKNAQNERRPTRSHVDDGSTCKIDGGDFG